MKKGILIALLICTKQLSSQTRISIPDANFATSLKKVVRLDATKLTNCWLKPTKYKENHTIR